MRAAGRAVLVLLAVAAVPAPAAAEQLLDRITAERLASDARFDVPERWSASGRPTLALALSGGGGYGAAHLGVLQAMFEDGVEIDGVAGTSIGALIGAFVCAGYAPEEIEQVLRGKNWDALVSGLDVRRRVLSRNEELLRAAQLSVSLRAGRRTQVGALTESTLLKRELYRYFLRAQLESGGDFDRLRYRYRAVATDVLSGTAYVPAGGDLVTLVRGSSAVPGLFRPVPTGGALLVDGGLVQNIPVEAAEVFGTDLVLAVDVSERVITSLEVSGALDVLNRSVNIMMERRSGELLARADVVVAPAVQEFSQASVGGDIDALVTAGREAYRRERRRLWERLERAAAGSGPVDYARIEVSGTDWIDADLLAARLGGASGTVTRFRVSAELARALNRGPLAGGHVDRVAAPDGPVLRFVFVEQPPIAAVETRVEGFAPRGGPATPAPLGRRFSPPLARRLVWQARERMIESGRVLVRLTRLDWDPATGNVSLRLDSIPVRRIDTEVEGDARLMRVRRLLRDLEGREFTFDSVANRLDELVARGAVQDWTLLPRRDANGEVELVARMRGESLVEASGSGAFRGPLGFAGFLRGARSNLTGRGDLADATLVAGKDRLRFEARYRAEFAFGFRDFGLEFGGRYFDDDFLFVDREQELVDDLREPRSGGRLWVSLNHRLHGGAVIEGGLARQRDRLDATATDPALRLNRTTAFLDLELDRHDRLLFPERGGRLHVTAEAALAGDELWRAEAAGDAVIGLDRSRRSVLTARLALGLSGDAERRPLWFDPGGFRDLYGFIPYGAAAPQYARAGLVWRYRLLDLNLARIYVEAGVDGVTLAQRRDDLFDDGGTAGFGASVTAFSKLIGPITVGIAGNGDGAELIFVNVGFPLPE